METKKRFLIVEDDLMDAETLKKDLSTIIEDIEFLGPVTSYQKAKSLLQTEKPDIAYLDIELEDRKDGGIELAKYIKTQYEVPFIFLTGLPDDQCFDVAKKTLPVNFLKKPYDYDSLKRTTMLALQHLPGQYKPQEDFTLMVKPLLEDKIWINNGRGNYVGIKVKDIAIVKAHDHYLQITHRNGQKLPLFKSTLRDFYHEKLIPYRIFFALSRSLVIQLNLVDQINDNHIHIGNDRFSIPKNVRETLFAALNIK